MFESALRIAATLTTAWLFGGMLLFAAGFAAFLFSALPIGEARALIRKAFPHFYAFVIILAAVAAAATWPLDRVAALVMAAIALTTLPTRQVLMPAINAATDLGDRRRFAQLHGLSVLITLAHIGAAGVVLSRFLR
jgi:hypothetical protein